ncbi:endonuclease/exonuclease/phosphatase family protein [Neiella marina]|uniref:Endonuclease/exonuclease/phosphatase family protein n=1 Tax=Neiella holothuriorum TaxID=2870530 RepID=A0ABS7EHK0_9GAMM|nr:endonuclease/exonuclease/phosphatase family protein [Neiella holothuriorum]MBW8191152.1 endonuclease/exonuclease/phosphatase family protein [Neiella holothuriorum]
MSVLSWLLAVNLSLPWQLVEHHQVLNNQQQVVAGQCSSQWLDATRSRLNDPSIALPNPFELVVWNTYKQQLPGFQAEFERVASQTDVLALQEVVAEPWLVTLLGQPEWFRHQSNAFFSARQHGYAATGVSTSARVPARHVCGWWAEEPWLPVPKTALLTVFSLSDEGALWLVNLHAINFTLGVIDYQNQLEQISRLLKWHTGPIIVSGDFNSWRETRHDALVAFNQELGLEAVSWQPDERVTFLGQPVDHVFYRGLVVEQAAVEATQVSDHSRLRVRFKLFNAD